MNLPWPFQKKRVDPPASPVERALTPALSRDGGAGNLFLGSHNIALIERLCSNGSGRYVNANDVLISALRLLEEHEEGREQRRRASYASTDHVLPDARKTEEERPRAS